MITDQVAIGGKEYTNHQISHNHQTIHSGNVIHSNKSQIVLSVFLRVIRKDSSTIATCWFERATPFIVIFLKKSGIESVVPERKAVMYHLRLSRLKELSASRFSKCANVHVKRVSFGNNRLSSFHSVSLTSTIRSRGLHVILSNVLLKVSVIQK